MTEKLDPKPVLYLWDDDISRVATEVYGRRFSVIDSWSRCDEGVSQDTLIRLTVPDVDDWRCPPVDRWLATEPPDATDWSAVRGEKLPSLQGVANDLHERGLMEAGDYVVHVWW